MNVDSPLLDVHRASPDPVEELSAAIDPVWMVHEKMQQPVFRRAQRDFRIVYRDPVTPRIQLELPSGDHFVLSLGPATQHGLDASEQLPR